MWKGKTNARSTWAKCVRNGVPFSIPVHIIKFIYFRHVLPREHGGGGAVDGGEDACALEEGGMHFWNLSVSAEIGIRRTIIRDNNYDRSWGKCEACLLP